MESEIWNNEEFDKLTDTFLCIDKAENIYDILVILYSCIDNKKRPSHHSEYYRKFQLDEYKDIIIKLNTLTDSVLKFDIHLEHYKERLKSYLRKSDINFICVHILFYFDQVFWDKSSYPLLGFCGKAGVKPYQRIGPLNTYSEKYQFFLLPQDSLLKETDQINLSDYRAINRKDSSDIFFDISSYAIKKKEDVKVNIIEYLGQLFDFSKQKSLKIAVIPISNQRWFKDDKKPGFSGKVRYFDILDDLDAIDENNEAYIRMIQQAEANQADIIIFPELAMNHDTEQKIKRYLMLNAIKRNSTLKLLFLGSKWENGTNECVLMSGSGSVLVRNQKDNPFEYQDNTITYREHLKERPDQYTLLDMKHLGRILYLVCKDGLNDIWQVKNWVNYGVNIEVVSSYSNSISHFENELSDLAEKYLGIGIVANCCEPRKIPNGENDISVGLLEIPSIMKNEYNQTKGKTITYSKTRECAGDCRFCDCIHMYTIYLDRLEESETSNSMKVVTVHTIFD